jgi:hypothetical protein
VIILDQLSNDARAHLRERELRIGRFLHPKPKIRNLRLNWQYPRRAPVQFWDFGFEMQESFNFKISLVQRNGH